MQTHPTDTRTLHSRYARGSSARRPASDIFSHARPPLEFLPSPSQLLRDPASTAAPCTDSITPLVYSQHTRTDIVASFTTVTQTRWLSSRPLLSSSCLSVMVVPERYRALLESHFPCRFHAFPRPRTRLSGKWLRQRAFACTASLESIADDDGVDRDLDSPSRGLSAMTNAMISFSRLDHLRQAPLDW